MIQNTHPKGFHGVYVVALNIFEQVVWSWVGSANKNMFVNQNDQGNAVKKTTKLTFRAKKAKTYREQANSSTTGRVLGRNRAWIASNFGQEWLLKLGFWEDICHTYFSMHRHNHQKFITSIMDPRDGQSSVSWHRQTLTMKITDGLRKYSR